LPFRIESFIREGKFPQGIKLGSKTTVWRAEDIRNLIERSR
jgi:predicted DNA-binding transcriptional regulator AlpA